jgi:hypothetical protein
MFWNKTEEEMTMLVTRRPERGGPVSEYRRLTMLDRVRMLIDNVRRVKRAR